MSAPSYTFHGAQELPKTGAGCWEFSSRPSRKEMAAAPEEALGVSPTVSGAVTLAGMAAADPPSAGWLPPSESPRAILELLTPTLSLFSHPQRSRCDWPEAGFLEALQVTVTDGQAENPCSVPFAKMTAATRRTAMVSSFSARFLSICDVTGTSRGGRSL